MNPDIIKELEARIAAGEVRTIPDLRHVDNPKSWLHAWVRYALTKRGTTVHQEVHTEDRERGWTNYVHTLTISIPVKEMKDGE